MIFDAEPWPRLYYSDALIEAILRPWVDLHTERMTVVVVTDDGDWLTQTVDAEKLPTLEDPDFSLGDVTFKKVDRDLRAVYLYVSNDAGVDLYETQLKIDVPEGDDFTLTGISGHREIPRRPANLRLL